METELETRRNVSTSSLTLAGQEVYNVTVSLYLIPAQYISCNTRESIIMAVFRIIMGILHTYFITRG